jgi:NADH:ubiquinone oxidoreductase subunit 2 (subunit N)
LSSIISCEYYFSAIVIIILSSIACFYYIRLIKIIFFSKSYGSTLWFSCSNRQNTEILVSPLLLFNVIFFTFPDLLSDISIVLGLVLL